MLQINLKSYNAILKRSFHIAKQNYFETCFNKCKSDIKNTWKTINEIICKDNAKKTITTYFKEAESIIVDEVDIAKQINAFFTEIGPNLASIIKYQEHFDHSHYKKIYISSVFTFKPVEEEIISRTTMKLANKNSCGLDGISTNLLKRIEPAIAKPLTILTNQVLGTGVFPDKL